MGLDTVEIVLWAEETFGIEIPNDEAAEVRTLRDFCLLIARLSFVKQGMLSAPSYAAIYDRLARYLMQEWGIEHSQIREAAEFVKDLGLD